MKDIYRSVSMDKGRIGVVENSFGIHAITKRTTVKEFANTTEMNTYLESAKQFEWQDTLYRVVTPKIISWSENTEILTLEFKEGQNLEASLSSMDSRTQNVNFTQCFINWMKKSGTFWRGLAPRHILINSDQKEISLLDFERPNTLKQNGFNDEEYTKLLRGLVHEEFCAFLFENEQHLIFPNFWDTNVFKQDIPLNIIHGKRVKLLLEYFFGQLGETIQTEQLHFVYKFMSSIITPFFVENKPFFPLKAIDETAREPKDYVDTVLQLSKIEKSEWPTYLKYEIN